MALYELSENNSGGSFWLSRRDYERLFEDGWFIHETERSEFSLSDDFGRYDAPRWGSKEEQGEGVPYSWRHNLRVEASSMQEAVERFEAATGQDFFAEGCNCCGAPFTMYAVEDGERSYGEYLSGDSVQRQVIRPW